MQLEFFVKPKTIRICIVFVEFFQKLSITICGIDLQIIEQQSNGRKVFRGKSKDIAVTFQIRSDKILTTSFMRVPADHGSHGKH